MAHTLYTLPFAFVWRFHVCLFGASVVPQQHFPTPRRSQNQGFAFALESTEHKSLQRDTHMSWMKHSYLHCRREDCFHCNFWYNIRIELVTWVHVYIPAFKRSHPTFTLCCLKRCKRCNDGRRYFCIPKQQPHNEPANTSLQGKR